MWKYSHYRHYLLRKTKLFFIQVYNWVIYHTHYPLDPSFKSSMNRVCGKQTMNICVSYQTGGWPHWVFNQIFDMTNLEVLVFSCNISFTLKLFTFYGKFLGKVMGRVGSLLVMSFFCHRLRKKTDLLFLKINK